jgi:hypothetical protein
MVASYLSLRSLLPPALSSSVVRAYVTVPFAGGLVGDWLALIILSGGQFSCPEDNFPVRRTILLPNFSEITM